MKIGYILGLGTLLLLVLGLGWFLKPEHDNTLQQIRQRGTVRVGLDASFPPFENFNPTTNQIEGLDVDLAQIIAADMGVKVELVNISFDGLYDALIARQVEVVISGLPYDARRTQDVAYSHHYFNAGQVLLVRADETNIHTASDLANRTVAIEWGSQAEMTARQLTQKTVGLTLLRQPSPDQVLATLLNKQADAAMVDGIIRYKAETKGLKFVTYLTDEWYTIAVQRDSAQVLEAINHTLTHLEQNGDLAKLKAKWCQ